MSKFSVFVIFLQVHEHNEQPNEAQSVLPERRPRSSTYAGASKYTYEELKWLMVSIFLRDGAKFDEVTSGQRLGGRHFPEKEVTGGDDLLKK